MEQFLEICDEHKLLNLRSIEIISLICMGNRSKIEMQTSKSTTNLYYENNEEALKDYMKINVGIKDQLNLIEL